MLAVNGAVADERFSRKLRLRKRAEFLRAQDRGARLVAEPLLVFAYRNGTSVTRLGITVSSKVGNAVVRSRIRRLLREVFRRKQGSLPVGIDLVLIARQGAKDVGFERLSQAFDSVAVKLRRMVP